MMQIRRKRRFSLYVDRSSRYWVAEDEEGMFWTIPVMEEAWVHRQPFNQTDKTELEPVPDHYKHVLGLPF